MNGEEKLSWEEVSCEHVVKDEWIDFRRQSFRLPDGTVSGPFYSYSRRDYCVIAAVDEGGRYLCVRQYRHGLREVTTEFPAGGLETKGAEYDRSTSEDALEAAKRELLEETGYTAQKWTPLLSIPSNATIADNYAYLFLAQGCRKVGGQHLDETEFLGVETCTEEEIGRLVEEGKFQQAMHVLCWLLARKAMGKE